MDRKFFECEYCGLVFEDGNQKKCPRCGSDSILTNIHLTDSIKVSETGKKIHEYLDEEEIKEFTEKDNTKHYLVIFLTVLPPFLGLFIAGFPGVIIGLFLSLINYFLGPKAITKVREITKTKNRDIERF